MNIPKYSSRISFGYMREVLKRLGNPQDSFKVIHVAGTNGKGSVCAFLSSILTEAGVKTGMFTSPHLNDIRERFQIQNSLVDKKKFCLAFKEVKEQVEQLLKEGFPMPPFFTFLFFMSLLIFQAERVEYAVMESGLGGRLDAVNSIDHPVLSVITSIGMDHMEVLGDTIEKIAFEKAGIIKEGIPVVYDGRNEKVCKVIEQIAQQKSAKSYKISSENIKILEMTDKTIDFLFQNRYYGTVNLQIPFIGEYQVYNGALAAASVFTLHDKLPLSKKQIHFGIQKTRWQGRMEQVRPGVFLDGAHNTDGIAECMKTFRKIEKVRNIHLLFGACTDKDYKKMIDLLCQDIHYKQIAVTSFHHERSASIQELRKYFEEKGQKQIRAYEEPLAALYDLMEQKKENELIFCIGSLYLIAELKQGIS